MARTTPLLTLVIGLLAGGIVGWSKASQQWKAALDDRKEQQKRAIHRARTNRGSSITFDTEAE
jgi:uncharacterized protein HemY